ncbi:MAG: hypothetical protein CMI53_04550 [Parcubacteria group bacterium]|nr:hypothetical protein [Parcubacteria group bacterium]
MVKIIPAVLAYNKEEFDFKIESLKGLVDWVQVDAYPGLYWDLDIPFKVEAHVMLRDPDLSQFQKADRIVVHQGDVSWSGKDYVLVLSVEAGKAGQEFKEDSLDIVKKLRSEHPHIDIAVDGGVNLENCERIVEAGANILIVGSYLFNSKNIKESLHELQNCGFRGSSG